MHENAPYSLSQGPQRFNLRVEHEKYANSFPLSLNIKAVVKNTWEDLKWDQRPKVTQGTNRFGEFPIPLDQVLYLIYVQAEPFYGPKCYLNANELEKLLKSMADVMPQNCANLEKIEIIN